MKIDYNRICPHCRRHGLWKEEKDSEIYFCSCKWTYIRYKKTHLIPVYEEMLQGEV